MGKYANQQGRDLLTALVELENNGPTKSYQGICGNVSAYLVDHMGYQWSNYGAAMGLLNEVFQLHPDYSGDMSFPIPATDAWGDEVDPGDAYCLYSLWGDNAYGDARRKYLRDSIVLLRSLINDGV